MITHQYTQTEKAVFGFAGLFVIMMSVYFFGFKKSSMISNHAASELQVNYDMAKVKSTESPYSLEGREIEYEYQGLEGKNNNKNSITGAVAGKGSGQAKGAELAKGQAAQKSQKSKSLQQAQQNGKQNKSNDEAKSGLQNDQLGVATDAQASAEQNNNLQQNFAEPINAVSAPIADEKTEDTKKKNFKSIIEWRKEILSSSQKEIVLKFVEAYKKNEIKSVEFYQLVNELVIQQDEVKKGYGLYALRATPSFLSYSALVKAQEGLNPTYQNYVEESLLSYNQVTLLPILKQALGSNQKNLILKTLEITKIGVLGIKAGTTSNLVDSRYRRDADFMAFSLNNYVSFQPILNRLQAQYQQTGEQQILASIQQVLQVLDGVSAVAAN